MIVHNLFQTTCDYQSNISEWHVFYDKLCSFVGATIYKQGHNIPVMTLD